MTRVTPLPPSSTPCRRLPCFLAMLILSFAHVSSALPTRLSARPDMRRGATPIAHPHPSHRRSQGDMSPTVADARGEVAAGSRLRRSMLAQTSGKAMAGVTGGKAGAGKSGSQKAGAKKQKTGVAQQKAVVTKQMTGGQRYAAFLAVLKQMGGFDNYIRALVDSGFGSTLSKLMKGYQMTVFVPLDKGVLYGPLTPAQEALALSLHVVFGQWSAATLSGAPAGVKLLTAANFPPAARPYVNIYKLNPKGTKGRIRFSGTKGATRGFRVVSPNIYFDGTLRVHSVDRLLDPWLLTDSPVPPPVPPPGPLPEPSSKAPPMLPYGLQRYRTFLAALRSAGEYNGYIKALETTGYNNTLAAMMNFFQLTILAPKDMSIRDSQANSTSFAIQRLGAHTLIGQFNSTDLNCTGRRVAPKYMNSGMFPPAPVPGMFTYKLNGLGLVFNGSTSAKTGARLVAPDLHTQKYFVSVHGVDKLMTPNRFWVDNLSNVLTRGQARYLRFIAALQGDGGFRGFLRLLSTTGYGDTLSNLFSFFQLTILVPKNVAVQDNGPGSSWAIAQRISVHVLLGDYPYSQMLSAGPGTQFLTADLMPPAPKPGMFIYKIGNSLKIPMMFNGTKDARRGVKIIDGDFYVDSGRVRVHVVDKLMSPYRFFVI